LRRIGACTGLLALFLVLFRGGLSGEPGIARATNTWTVDSYEGWDAGESQGAFITSSGEVRPGWVTDRLDLPWGSTWAALRLPDGTVVCGTDEDGAIFAIAGGKSRKLTVLIDALAVVSLAAAADGTIYAGTMPGGQIWRIDGKSGKSQKLVELPTTETVWALALSQDGGTLYAGTGPAGVLFGVDTRSGKASLLFDSEDKRIMSLARAGDGSIWFGTSERALVFRLDPKSRQARAMADFAGNEITAIAAQDGSVVVAANDLQDPSTTGAKTRVAVNQARKKEKAGHKPQLPKTGSGPGAEEAAPSGSEPPRKGARKGKGALYRIWGDARIEQLHALTQTYFTSVVITDKNQIFAGAGDKGRIYLIQEDGEVSTAIDVEQRLVTQLLWDGKHGLSFVTGDASALYTTRGAARRALYLSDVFDSRAPARFGKIRWHGSGPVRLETRSGNTAEPGPGWSPWASPSGVTQGGGDSRWGIVSSPAGRYLQFRAAFGETQEASLRTTTVYYLPQNRPTVIKQVSVSLQKDSGLVTMQAGATKPRNPVLKIKWTIDNPDGDETMYRLSVRREGDLTWRNIRPGKAGELTGTSFDWNTEPYADGFYRLKVTATDRRSNPSGRAMESHRTTPLFLVDNTRPTLSAVKINYPAASASASDSISAITEVAFSIDDGPWQVGSSQDGLLDELTEIVRLELPTGLEPGVHTLSIRVADEVGNIGATAVDFQVK
jgi:sugar lactone lactonase YvrE